MYSLLVLGTLLLAPLSQAAPFLQERAAPGIPTAADAKTRLATLTVAAQGPDLISTQVWWQKP